MPGMLIFFLFQDIFFLVSHDHLLEVGKKNREGEDTMYHTNKDWLSFCGCRSSLWYRIAV